MQSKMQRLDQVHCPRYIIAQEIKVLLNFLTSLSHMAIEFFSHLSPSNMDLHQLKVFIN
jgi:hypothetical protein